MSEKAKLLDAALRLFEAIAHCPFSDVSTTAFAFVWISRIKRDLQNA